jgi:hypothetical protein
VLSADGKEPLAQALVCPDIEYAGVLWGSTSRLERRSATQNLWHSFKNEMAGNVPAGVLPQVSAAGLILVGPRVGAVQVRYVGSEVVEPTRLDATTWLDRRLRDMRPLA